MRPTIPTITEMEIDGRMVKVGDMVLVADSVTQRDRKTGEYSEIVEIKFGFIQRFIRDKQNEYTSFMVRFSKSPNSDVLPYPQRIYFKNSPLYDTVYTKSNITFLEGNNPNDYPEYFL
jgi:hypothetical protein